ncbi:hypothetical protein [Streptomyces telluris]|uniref:Uncharacterized protein n=1 Tax=Streptomyces telluris TaxID=2720021 RepID=A0A9X2RJT3_9ACTN|nr:hypothetical protein [Streptomyces telluris]MCQ8769047.1 hypothetical protein [Streptomyces telluris]NJP78041.1 hypothetical protein [Streptomyces telluris]
MKRTLLTAAVAPLLAFAALAPGAASAAPAPAQERPVVSAAQDEPRPPVLTLPTTQRCTNCGGPTDTSWGGTTGRQK